jgi:hypothetical protein
VRSLLSTHEVEILVCEKSFFLGRSAVLSFVSMQDEVQTTISGPKTLRLPIEDLEVFDMLKQWLYQESIDPLPNVPKAPFSEWIGADRIGIDGIKKYWGASTRIPAEPPFDPWHHIRFCALTEALDIPAATEAGLKRLGEAAETALPSFNEEQVDWVYTHTTQSSKLCKFVLKIIFGAACNSHVGPF